MKSNAYPASGRAAFTLLEILVVVAIIAILTALTAAGVFQVINSQRNANAQNTIKAVSKALQQQMRWVIDKADKEPIPASVLALATPPTGADPQTPKRARVIWKKLRLKQEFPMTFAEALNPNLTYAGAATTVSSTDLPAKKSYVNALTGKAAANSAKWPFIESSTCLLLALQEKRGGTAVNIDELNAAALDLNGDGLKELVDPWNNPIAFFRFPTSNDAPIAGNNAMDAANPAGPNDTAAKFRDPYDPEGTLVNPAWNNYGNWTAGGVGTFEQMCHLVHIPNSTLATSTSYQPWPRYMLPTLVSAGRDGLWGINNAFSATPQTGVNPDMSIDPATIDANGNWYGGDNFFSFQLQ